MRRMPLLWLLLAAICGGVLFHTSQQVNDGRQRLAMIRDDIRKEDETIRVLRAEWGYLNQPDRLEKLSKQYLNLGPLKGRQFTRLQDIADVPAPAAPIAEAASKPAETPAAPAPIAAMPPMPAPVAVAAVPAEPPKFGPETSVTTTSATAPAAPVTSATVKSAAVKPPPARTAKATPPKAFIVKIRTPPAAPKHPAPVATAERMQDRSFGDVMKSLGVQ